MIGVCQYSSCGQLEKKLDRSWQYLGLAGQGFLLHHFEVIKLFAEVTQGLI